MACLEVQVPTRTSCESETEWPSKVLPEEEQLCTGKQDTQKPCQRKQYDCLNSGSFAHESKTLFQQQKEVFLKEITFMSPLHVSLVMQQQDTSIPYITNGDGQDDAWRQALPLAMVKES